MDTTQQQVGKWYILRVYFVKYDTAAMSRIINLCLCAYLLCFSEKTQVDRQENIKMARCNILKTIVRILIVLKNLFLIRKFSQKLKWALDYLVWILSYCTKVSIPFKNDDLTWNDNGQILLPILYVMMAWQFFVISQNIL